MKSCLICDDHIMVRDALAATIKMGWPKAKITTASDFKGAWAAMNTAFDLCLIDLVMPGAAPIEGIQKLLEMAPDLPVIVITGTEDDAIMFALLDLGVRGFVPKSSSTAIIDAAIRLVIAGGRYLPERMIHLASPTAKKPTLSSPGNVGISSTCISLTPRQIRVMKLVAEGKTNKEIGRDLGIAPSTVKTHIDQILLSLKVSNRTEAVRAALDCGVI